MSEKGFLKEISRLKNRFNKLKQQIENEKIHLYCAQDLANDLLKEMSRLTNYMVYLNIPQNLNKEFLSLISQTRDLYFDIADIVEIERNQILGGNCE